MFDHLGGLAISFRLHRFHDQPLFLWRKPGNLEQAYPTMEQGKSSMKSPDVTQQIYQMKVTLLGTKPPIWRRVLVPSDFTLEKLHLVIQSVMGWTDSHLHEFRIGKETYGMPNPEERLMGMPLTKSERTARLGKVLDYEGAKAEYIYDFGDDWIHTLTVEKILDPEPGKFYPICIAGKLQGPPEDCGGPYGYSELLKILSDPKHPEHKERKEWLSAPHDPADFTVKDADDQLADLRRGPRSKRAAQPSL